ncbi:uncharacterized protein A4U43_C08F35960 [Asparagus officinalis]|nr:uncharacterized protein A4U43_C08F35960 [Asparagus officinalis]
MLRYPDYGTKIQAQRATAAGPTYHRNSDKSSRAPCIAEGEGGKARSEDNDTLVSSRIATPCASGVLILARCLVLIHPARHAGPNVDAYGRPFGHMGWVLEGKVRAFVGPGVGPKVVVVGVSIGRPRASQWAVVG